MKFISISMSLTKIKFIFVLLFTSTFFYQVQAQTTVEVTGLILDADFKEPMVFANVVEKGTNTGTVTDSDGRFSLKVRNTNATLVISFMGFKTKEVALNGRTDVTIELDSDSSVLDDVVVVGYGTVKKSDLTGSIATISGKDIQKVPIANVSEALTGRLAGVQITSSEGSPDSEIRVRIRGGGSLTQDASPLLIVDGFPVESINDISPSDIENITVLKDASSTAIYGARGANGVILITTKSGLDGSKLNVSYNLFTGFATLANTLDVLSPSDYVNWQYEFALLRYNNPNTFTEFFGNWEDRAQYNNLRGINWQREIYGRTGKVQSHDINLRGGSEKLRYSFNYALYDLEGIMIGSSFKRNNISFNLKNKVNQKVDLGFTFRYSNTTVRGSGANEQREFSSSDARLRHSIGYAPILIPELVTDDTDEAIQGYLVNPFVAVADNDRTQRRQNFNMMGSFSWKVAKDLKFKSDFGFDTFYFDEDRFFGRSTFYVRNVPLAENQNLPALIRVSRQNTRFRIANTLDYDFKNRLGEDHNLKLLLGQEYLLFKSTEQTNTIHGFPKFYSFQNAVNLMGSGDPFSVQNFAFPDNKLLSFFGRANYDFKNKYLFTATMRADGSSKFLGDNRWGYFPSAAVAWKIKEEDFLKDVSWLNELKVRFSYGVAGNENIPVGQTIQLFTPGITSWINDMPNFLSASNILANPDLKWETTYTNNLGLDYELFNGRINGSFELYKNITRDLLLRFEVAGTGYLYQYRNMGETQNTGLEATLNLEALKGKDYGLNIAFNIGMNRNQINSLGMMDDFGQPTGWASTAIGNDFLVAAGRPVGLIYGFKNAGRYELHDFSYNNGVYTLLPGVTDNSSITGAVRPGSMKIKDVNGDGVIDQDDLTVIGDTNPASTGGIVFNGFWKNFDIMAAFNWSFGNDVYNASKIEHSTATISTPDGQYRNLLSGMGDGRRWTNLDPVSGQLVTDPVELAALNANTTMWSPYMARFVLTDWAVEDGSFLRLNTLSLGYTFSENMVSKLGATRLRLYFTANNVFILTKYSGLDPEVNTRRQTPLTPGVDYSPYPRNRQYVFGMNLSF